MVIYGILTEQNIAKLFMAGVIPGLLQALFYAVVVGIMCRINPALGPACAPFPPRERVRSLKGTWPVFALFLLVIGGIYKGRVQRGAGPARRRRRPSGDGAHSRWRCSAAV